MYLSSNKKILITVAVFVVVIAALTGILKLAGSRPYAEEETTTAPVYEATSDEANSDNYIQEYPTKELTTVAEMNSSSITAEEIAAMNAYIAGQYYLEGVMYTDGTPSEINLAISGKNFQTSMDMDGTSVSIMYLNGKVYFVDDAAKVYLELSDLLMNTMDVDLSEMEEITRYLSLEAYNFTHFNESKTEIDGAEANCYTYSNDSEAVSFNFIDNELRQIVYGDVNGNTATVLTIYEFSPEIPSGMLTLSGLNRTTISAFLSSYMAE